MKDLTNLLNGIRDRMELAQGHTEALKKECDELEKENAKFRKRVKALEIQINTLERVQRVRRREDV